MKKTQTPPQLSELTPEESVNINGGCYYAYDSPRSSLRSSSYRNASFSPTRYNKSYPYSQRLSSQPWVL